MANWLGQHPDVFFPTQKEPGYFIHFGGNPTLQSYEEHYRDSGDFLRRGDASVGYLFHPTAAKEIQEYCPSAKIIAILRNPTDMVFSYWQYNRATSEETLPFEKAISTKIQRTRRKDPSFQASKRNWAARYLYLLRASYAHQIRRYQGAFIPEQLLFLGFEEFVASPRETIGRVFEFLEVESSFQPDFRPKNIGGAQRSKLVHRIAMGKYPWLRPLFSKSLRGQLRQWSVEFNMNPKKKTIMNEETRERLNHYFRGEKERVFKLLGRRLQGWDG